MTEPIKKKRGRPAGSKNKKRTVKTLKEQRNDMSQPLNKPFMFTSDSCDCVYYSTIMGSAMFCKHKNPMMGRKV